MKGRACEMTNDGFSERATSSSSHVMRRVTEHIKFYGKKNRDGGGALQPKPVDRVDEGDESFLECDEQGLSEELATPDVGPGMVMGPTGWCVVSDGDSPSTSGQPALDVRGTRASLSSRSALPKEVESVKRNNSTETAVTARRVSSLTASPGPSELIGGYVQLMPLMLHALDRLRRGRSRRRSPLRFTPGKPRIRTFFFCGVLFQRGISFSCPLSAPKRGNFFIFSSLGNIPHLPFDARASCSEPSLTVGGLALHGRCRLGVLVSLSLSP